MKATSLLLSMGFAAALYAPSAMLMAQVGTPNGNNSSQEDVNLQNIRLLVVRPNVGQWGGMNSVENPNALDKNHRLTFEIYAAQQLLDLANDLKTHPSGTYTSFAAAAQGQNFTAIYFTGDGVINSLSAADQASIRTQVTEGDMTQRAVVGTVGSANVLLGLVNLLNGNPVEDQPGQIFFTRTSKGGRTDLILMQGPDTTGAALLKKAALWKYETNPRLGDAGPWASNYAQQFRGTMNGGEWGANITVYKLNSTDPASDWWRVDTNVITVINNYDKAGGHCGWYTTYIKVTDTPVAANYPAAKPVLYEWMPTGTINDRSVTYSIGGGLEGGTSGGGGSVSGSYSATYGGADVQVVDHSSLTNATPSWTINFAGPDYTWYPWYVEPANTARSTFYNEPSAIYRVPKGAGLHLTIQSVVEHRYDTLKFYVFVLKIEYQKYWHTQTNTLHLY